MVVAGQSEAEWRIGHCGNNGYRFSDAVRHVWHGRDKRAVGSHGRPSAGHENVSGGRLPGGRCVRCRTLVPKGVRPGARLLPDGRVARLLDGVPNRGAHDAGVKNGVRAV